MLKIILKFMGSHYALNIKNDRFENKEKMNLKYSFNN